jgi:hypothetical protein
VRAAEKKRMKREDNNHGAHKEPHESNLMLEAIELSEKVYHRSVAALPCVLGAPTVLPDTVPPHVIAGDE